MTSWHLCGEYPGKSARDSGFKCSVHGRPHTFAGGCVCLQMLKVAELDASSTRSDDPCRDETEQRGEAPLPLDAALTRIASLHRACGTRESSTSEQDREDPRVVTHKCNLRSAAWRLAVCTGQDNSMDEVYLAKTRSGKHEAVHLFHLSDSMSHNSLDVLKRLQSSGPPEKVKQFLWNQMDRGQLLTIGCTRDSCAALRWRCQASSGLLVAHP